jgi:hypothetical protein
MTRQKSLSCCALALAALWGTGCQGDIQGNGTGTGPGNGGGSNGGPGNGSNGGPGPTGGGGNPTPSTPGTKPDPMTPAPGDPNAAGPMPLRRLTVFEYNNTVRDLLGVTGNPAKNFPRDIDSQTDFTIFHRAGIVATDDLDAIKDAAEASAAGVEAMVTTIAPCSGGAAEDECARKFITDFGLRAFRRPVTPDEATRLFGLYTTGRTTLTLNYPGAIRLLVEGILQSTAFLYRWELGYDAPTVEGNVVRLNGYEVASRLSYFIWGSMPDAALFTAAASNQLSTQAQILAQAKRMVADPKAKATLANFTSEWLSLDGLVGRPKDPMVYPEWNPALQAAMNDELQTFTADTVFNGDGKFTSLLTSTKSFMTAPLAKLYGIQGGGGMAATPGTLDGSQRAGLFTRAGWLSLNAVTDRSSPTKRGHRLYERALCGDLPPPPANVPPPKAATEAGTTRQHMEEHDKNACATACHSIMDPIGFGFENYDGVGKYRTTDNRLPVDSTGSITIDGTAHPFKNAIELSGILAASDTVNRCFSTMWLRYATKRNELAADQASLNDSFSAFTKAGSISDLMVAVAGSRTFRYRSPAMGEVLK